MTALTLGHIKTTLLVGAMAFFWCGFSCPAQAQESESEPESFDGEANQDMADPGAGAPEESTVSYLDEIWALPVLISDDSHPFLQEFRFFGRYHGQGYAVHSQQGNVSGWDNRRFRLGARAIFLEHFTFGALFNLKTDKGTSVIDRENVDTLTLAWNPSENLQLAIGQQKPGFTYEYATSSNRILTFERSLLVDQFAPDKSPGLSIGTRLREVDFTAGVYSGATLGEDFDDLMGMVKLGYDLRELSRFEKNRTHFHYLHNSANDSEAAAPYRHAFAGGFDLQKGAYSSLIEVLYGTGYDEVPDVWGFTVMPAWFLVEDKLQLVARYHFASSQEENGLMLQNRYQTKVPDLSGDQLGDRYHAGYLGLNWYLYGNKLKIMAGTEYATMDGGSDGGDFSGWTWMTGLRLYF